MAFKGIDLRDLYRRGSGLTLRRLHVLVSALPPDALLWAVIRKSEEEATPQRATPEQIRERARHYEQREAV